MSTEKYGVIGHPIQHSKSPMIHQAFAAQIGKSISYERILAPLDGFVETVRRLQADGYLGANVTVPFKFEAYHMCDSRSDRAMETGAEALNTLAFSLDGKVHGDNTDGAGLKADIEHNFGFAVTGKSVLILGAGGAAQGVMRSLASAAKIVIANRTADKALKMVMSLHGAVDARFSHFEDLNEPFDLVVNATSAGLTDSKLPLSDTIFTSETLAYDMMYGRVTPFMAQAQQAGARVADGLGMLVEQAAEAFMGWHHVTRLEIDTAAVIKTLRQA